MKSELEITLLGLFPSLALKEPSAYNLLSMQAVFGALCSMQQSGVWIGASWWAAGPWWGDVSTSHNFIWRVLTTSV